MMTLVILNMSINMIQVYLHVLGETMSFVGEILKFTPQKQLHNSIPGMSNDGTTLAPGSSLGNKSVVGYLGVVHGLINRSLQLGEKVWSV
ncbi:hypothetical protein C5167_014885 [Papaver somniferum]|uniref:Uncharacterized protein n=1 Tax=Papaver somniferum TaxID=3469 RepID=A0A4Y7J8U6_PAPSO|nr:hypothetical protein C5167_014885 [Papaver somniferum]